MYFSSTKTTEANLIKDCFNGRNDKVALLLPIFSSKCSCLLGYQENVTDA